MFKQHKKLAVILLALAAALASLPYIFARQHRTPETPHLPAPARTDSQDLESKLARKADFIPGGKPAVDQLIAVAQHYRIPMGIEWVKKSGSPEPDVALRAHESGPTVRDLLQAIVSRLPGCQMTVDHGVAHVADPTLVANTNNFLNLRIDEFRVENENLFDAEEKLRLTIDMTLHPDEYENGYAGGYGYAPDDVLAKRNITFTGEDMLVREILDGLAKASGNALWIAQLDADDLKIAANSSTARHARNNNQEGTKSKYNWKFVPLVEKPSNRP